jgi:nicotinamidase-related amidase
MSGLWGYQSALDLYLQEIGITTLLIGGVNTDQVLSSFMLVLRTNSRPVAVRWRHTRRCILSGIRLRIS